MGEKMPGPDRPEGVDHDRYRRLLLRFFRDISPAQRISILAEFGAIPSDWKKDLSESFERRAFDSLIRGGRFDDVCAIVRRALEERVSE